MTGLSGCAPISCGRRTHPLSSAVPDRVELIYERGGRDGRFEQLPLSEAARTNNRETVSALVQRDPLTLTSNDPRIRKTWRDPAKSLLVC